MNESRNTLFGWIWGKYAKNACAEHEKKLAPQAEMDPPYSFLPAYPGTIKPKFRPFENLPPIAEHMNSSVVPEEVLDTYGVTPALLQKPEADYVKADLAPIPPAIDREGYHGNRHVAWWWSGLMTFLRCQELYNKYSGRQLKPSDTFFELGCSTGRVLRHAIFQGNNLKVIGCDINHRHVLWMQKFLPTSAIVFQNSDYPSLPLEDNSVDLAVACSVFTHIENLESTWLMELNRVLKPGGLLLATVVDDKYWQMLASDSYAWMANNLSQLNCDYEFDRDSFNKPMPSERVTLYCGGSDKATYTTTIFHSQKYIREKWSRYFHVMDILEKDFDIQTLVVLKK